MEWPIKNNLAYLLFMLCPLVGVLVYFGRYVTLILDVSRNLLHHCRVFDGRIAIVGCNLQWSSSKVSGLPLHAGQVWGYLHLRLGVLVHIRALPDGH